MTLRLRRRGRRFLRHLSFFIRFLNADAAFDAFIEPYAVTSDSASHGVALVNLGYAISELSNGTLELGTALRATYILLEQVQSSIPKAPGRKPFEWSAPKRWSGLNVS